MRSAVEWARALIRGALETALFLPALAAIALVVPDGRETVWFACFPLLYTVAYGLGAILRLKRRYQAYLAGAGASAAYSILLVGNDPAALALGILAAFAVVLRGIGSARLSWSDQFPITHRMTALAVYFIAYVVMFNLPQFDGYMPLLTWTGLAAFVYFLYDANRQNLRDVSFGNGHKDDPAVLAQNRALLTGILLLALVIAFFQTIRSALLWLRDRIAAWLDGLGSATGETAPPAESAPSAPAPFPQEPPGEPAAWLVWLEQILFYLFYAVLAALAIWLAFRLLRRLPALLRRLHGWLMRVSGREETAADYEDSVESLLQKTPFNKRLADLWKGKLLNRGGPKWSQLRDNRERIRYLYAAMLRRSSNRGYGVKSFLTPKETARDLTAWSGNALEAAAKAASEAYDSARYGSEPVRDDEVERVKALVDGKG